MSKDELVRDIAEQIANAPDLDPGWRSLAIVFTLGASSRSNFGYCYTGEGEDDWEAFTIRSAPLYDELARLRQILKDESGGEWRQALFQIIRQTRELKLNFAYDETRWKVTPGNLKEMIAALRP